jgi:hypothetical protein
MVLYQKPWLMSIFRRANRNGRMQVVAEKLQSARFKFDGLNPSTSRAFFRFLLSAPLLCVPAMAIGMLLAQKFSGPTA